MYWIAYLFTKYLCSFVLFVQGGHYHDFTFAYLVQQREKVGMCRKIEIEVWAIFLLGQEVVEYLGR